MSRSKSRAKANAVHSVWSSYQKVTSPDPKIRDMLPRSLKDMLLGRRSSRVQKSRQFFLKYTDLVYRAPGEELWEDLLRTKRYLELHVLLYAKNGDRSDDIPLMLYHADVPEIMLEMIQQSFSSDFFIGSAKMRCVPSLALSVLTAFMYAYSDTFTVVPDKLFHDSEINLEIVSLGAFHDKLTWFDKLSVVQFYGAASYSRACILFLQTHPDIVYELCVLMHRGMEMIEEKIKNHEINWQNETLACFLTSFRDDEDLETSSRLFGIHTVNHAAIFYKNIMDSTMLDFNVYQVVGKSVMKSEILRHFPFVVRQIMIWFEPGLYLNTFLTAISHTLGMAGAMQELLMENLSYTLEHKLPLGIDTFKYWGHATRFPNTIAWFLLHAFCHSKQFGSDWSAYILCHVLSQAEEKVTDEIVSQFGLDLMDLAHLVEVTQPLAISVQSTILEALLRYGKIQHKVYDRSNLYEGKVTPSDNMKEFVLEAALFCKKAQCETRMSEEKKQKLAMEADKVKDEGNTAFKSGNYMEAIMKYTDAIALCPLSARKKQAIYYSNRAECHLRSKNPKRAIHDCNRSLCLDTSAKLKVQWRRSRAYQKLNLDYPAWLDMKCLEKDWNLTSEQSGIDFNQLLISLGLQVGVVQRKKLSAIDRRYLSIFLYDS